MDRTIQILLAAIIFFFNLSCDREATERTWEQEIAELELMLKELETKGRNIDTTKLSVYYTTLKAGEGAFPELYDTLLITYTGYLPNGKPIDVSSAIHPPNGIWKCVYKPPHSVIGFVDGMGYMNKGAEVMMYITSDRAFGKKGTALVPPFTTVIYHATMIDVIPRRR